MPEAPKPSPPFDRGVSRNLFVEADPDLDALIESTADEPARAAGVRRRGRGLVVLAEPHRSAHARRAHDVERSARPNGNVGRLRAAARHWLRQTDAAAGRLLRGLAARPYRALAAIVALAGLLVAFSWLALDLRDTSRARAAADGRLARTAAALRYKAARIEALAAEMGRLERSASPTQASTAPAGQPDVRRPLAAREPPPAHRPYRRHG
jgi:hypothetical protein